MVLFNFKNLFAGSESLPLSSDFELINFDTSENNNGYVTANSALANSDIYSIIFQLSMDMANCVLKADKPKAQAIIDNPSATSNAHGFWEGMFAQLLLDGNAYAYRWRNANGTDKYWEYLRPSQVQVLMLMDGSGLVYNADFYEPEIGFKQNIPQSDMIHLRLMSRNGGKTGISPLTALANEVAIKQRSNHVTMNALSRAVTSPGILSIKKAGLLNAKEKAARSKQFVKQLNDSNNGPIVLDDLETYQPLELKADVAKLLQQANWTSTQIAKVYGLPDTYVNGQGDQQSSLKMIQGYYANALNRYIQNVVSELNNKLNATITANIRPATDPNGDTFAQIMGGMAKDKILDNDQAIAELEAVDYFPVEVPKAKNGDETVTSTM